MLGPVSLRFWVGGGGGEERGEFLYCKVVGVLIVSFRV